MDHSSSRLSGVSNRTSLSKKEKEHNSNTSDRTRVSCQGYTSTETSVSTRKPEKKMDNCPGIIVRPLVS